MSSDQYYTTEEFAKILKVNVQHIRRCVLKGLINGFRIGPGKKAPYRIPATELERMQIMSFEETKRNLEKSC